MTYKILILKKADKDLDWFRKNDKQSYIKCFDLVRAISELPRAGIGKPTQLPFHKKVLFCR